MCYGACLTLALPSRGTVDLILTAIVWPYNDCLSAVLQQSFTDEHRAGTHVTPFSHQEARKSSTAWLNSSAASHRKACPPCSVKTRRELGIPSAIWRD